MKRSVIAAVATALIALVGISGCGGNEVSPVSLGQPVVVPVPSLDNTIERSLLPEPGGQGATISEPADVPAPVSSMPDAGLEKAKATAFKHANVDASKAVLIKAEKDMEHGAVVYELEFFVGNTEYEYEVDAESGEIRSHSKDIDNFEVDD